jgi:hypothetical protein
MVEHEDVVVAIGGLETQGGFSPMFCLFSISAC